MANACAYLELCKPRVVALMLLTAIVGMQLASPHVIPLQILIFGTLGIAAMAAAAAVINHLADQHIDALMGRTQNRPLPSGRLTIKQGLFFAFSLTGIGLFILLVFVNTLTAVLTLLTLIGYAGIYTFYLKHATPQNIVIGGASGAAPPLLGWTAVTGHFDPQALLLVLIIFTWTPPHFWALAIARFDDYSKAEIPMLPVTHGVRFTKISILLYTLLLMAVSLLPYVTGLSGLFYLVTVLLLDGTFLWLAIKLLRRDDTQIAMQTFHYSILYLMLLFVSILVDHFIA